MKRFFAVVLLVLVGAYVWVVHEWAASWVLGVETRTLIGIVFAAATLIPLALSLLARFALGPRSFFWTIVISAVLADGTTIAALLLRPSTDASPPNVEEVVRSDVAPFAPKPRRMIRDGGSPTAVVAVDAPVEAPTDTFYKYELDGAVHVVSRLDDVPPAVRHAATPVVMARPSTDVAPKEPPASPSFPSRRAKATPEATHAVARLNDHRRDLGLPEVTLDAARTSGAQQHADYIRQNMNHPSAQGLGLHDEDPALPGYSQSGAIAGKNAVIAIQRGVAIDVVDQWMATFYHRVPLVHPSLKSVGFGRAEEGTTRIFVVDVQADGARTDVTIVPHDRATGVPRSFAGDELPNPIPLDADGQAGYPITFTFAPGVRVQDVRTELFSEARGVLPAWTSTPENPVVAGAQQNTVCVMAKDPLAANERHRVRVEAKVDGRRFDQTIHFVTE